MQTLRRTPLYDAHVAADVERVGTTLAVHAAGERCVDVEDVSPGAAQQVGGGGRRDIERVGARAALERATEIMHFAAPASRAIVRSVDEALANVIRHAYQGRPGQPIEVSCWRLRADGGKQSLQGIEIVLVDSGVPLDPAKLKGRPLDEIRPGGLGLHFMRQSMDKVEFSRKKGKNQLRLVKYLAPAASLLPPEGE